MAGEKKQTDDLAKALKVIADRPVPRALVGRPQARGGQRMMSVAERVAFADDIRSRSKPNDFDSTDLIRRDRDDR